MTTLLISLFSYALLLTAILRIPDQFLDKILEYFKKSLTLTREIKKSLPILGEICRGDELLLAVSECESRISLGIKILASSIPRYKFYTNILEQLFESHRLLGIGIKKFIPEIRLAIIKDLQFEKKILDEIISGLMQFLVIGLTTWSFVFLSKTLVEIPIDKMTVILMSGLEISGIVLFFYLVNILKLRVFFAYSNAIEELYLFSSLMDVGLPVNEVLQRSKILSGNLVSHKNFQNLANRLKKLVSRMKETGLSPKDETYEIIREIWHLQDVTFQKFTKMVQVLKFSILAFFFLPAYFIYLHSIFKFFMEQ